MAVRPPPLRFTETFNIHNYIQESSYLGNYGTQRLNGNLLVNNSTAYGDEVVYGDEHILGESKTESEPVITNITPLNSLTDHHLVSKYTANYITQNPISEPTVALPTSNTLLQSNQLATRQYVDYKVVRPSNEPTVTTATSNSLLLNNQLTTKAYVDYTNVRPLNEPVVTTPLGTNLLTNNHLVSKKYVDDKITESEANKALYPTNFFVGKNFVANSVEETLPSLDIESGLVYVKFKTLKYRIYTCCFDINYYINRSPPNSFMATWYGNSKTSIYLSSTYLVNWYMNDAGEWHNVIVYPLDGNALTNNYSFEGQTINFVKFRIIDNAPAISIGFPHEFNNTLSAEGWVSNYGCSIKLSTSTPNNIYNQNLDASNNSGIAYFSNTA